MKFLFFFKNNKKRLDIAKIDYLFKNREKRIEMSKFDELVGALQL